MEQVEGGPAESFGIFVQLWSGVGAGWVPEGLRNLLFQHGAAGKKRGQPYIYIYIYLKRVFLQVLGPLNWLVSFWLPFANQTGVHLERQNPLSRSINWAPSCATNKYGSICWGNPFWLVLKGYEKGPICDKQQKSRDSMPKTAG